MRETRTCGSEGGEALTGLSYPYEYLSPAGRVTAPARMFKRTNLPQHGDRGLLVYAHSAGGVTALRLQALVELFSSPGSHAREVGLPEMLCLQSN